MTDRREVTLTTPFDITAYANMNEKNITAHMAAQPLSPAAGCAAVRSIRPSAPTTTVMTTSRGMLLQVDPDNQSALAGVLNDGAGQRVLGR